MICVCNTNVAKTSHALTPIDLTECDDIDNTVGGVYPYIVNNQSLVLRSPNPNGHQHHSTTSTPLGNYPYDASNKSSVKKLTQQEPGNNTISKSITIIPSNNVKIKPTCVHLRAHGIAYIGTYSSVNHNQNHVMKSPVGNFPLYVNARSSNINVDNPQVQPKSNVVGCVPIKYYDPTSTQSPSINDTNNYLVGNYPSVIHSNIDSVNLEYTQGLSYTQLKNMLNTHVNKNTNNDYESVKEIYDTKVGTNPRDVKLILFKNNLELVLQVNIQ